jgi:glycosyltransferase involved in cell wall biosynthesis
MRIALFNQHASAVGGIEAYLRRLIPLLRAAGHEVALLHLHAPEAGRVAIAPEGLTAWCADELGGERALAHARTWGPDLVYAHSTPPPGPLESMSGLAPLVFFAHTYAGTCISGGKHHQRPVRQPCSRVFGPACLLLFYPRRCGGLNPLTMLADYKRQHQLLAWLRRCAHLVTHSEHMRGEFLHHDFPADRVSAIPFLVPPEGAAPVARKPLFPDGPARLLFLGRMDSSKGGDVLLRALPAVQSRLQRPLFVTLAGDGPERASWQALASHLCREPLLSVRFTGWVDEPGRSALLGETDLLVVPSLWPEPFGQVGVEAGRAGVPAVAFDVGGIRAWLTPEVNGRLAPGDPPTVEGLAEALAGVLNDPAKHALLAEGARTQAVRFDAERHLEALDAIFRHAVSSRPPAD